MVYKKRPCREDKSACKIVAITKRKEENPMSYETKVLLIAIAEIISKSKGVEEIYSAVQKMANAEGLILESLEEKRAKETGN